MQPSPFSDHAHTTILACTVACAAWGAGEWLGVVQGVLLARWRVDTSSRGVVWGVRGISGGCWYAVRAAMPVAMPVAMPGAMPVAMPARVVHPAHHYVVSGLSFGAGAHGCVLCWGHAGGALPVVMCCVSWFVHVCQCLQCACSVVPT